ncbi:MAG: DsbA family protein [Ilumatobacteraceae bacterium]
MSEQPPDDLEFFLDPTCPWCWLTSRWVTNVQGEKPYRVAWRFISLDILNEDKERKPEHRAAHVAGKRALRVADQVRIDHGNDAVGEFYTALGTQIHVEGRRDAFRNDTAELIAEALGTAGLDPALAAHLDDESHDAHLRAETELALSRTGPDVGTPILTFAPGQEGREGSFFGPVIAKAPRGAEALRLWDAVETLATTQVAELKRSLRSRPDFT